ncbi:hypothetical protein H8697_00985 [[Eubacterium] tenue]|nr:hypothetical protein [[Eubacterium] tenue]MBC8630284.1 hypothetical protein [[Eubacterium] tenue]
MKKCPMCYRYINIEDWPVYNGKYYTYCRDCKRITQREWIKAKREMNKK